jgi:ParB family chromosome partitioning protein
MVQEMIDRADAEPLGLVKEDGTKSRPRRNVSDQVAALEQEFRAALGVRVKLVETARGRGKLVIHFSNHEQFDRLREHICGPGLPGVQARAG